MEMVTDQLTQHEQTGLVSPNAGRLTPDQFMKYIDETRAQPAYRAAMDKAADYYDGNQLTAEILKTLDSMGFTSLMTNLIKPAIDTVLGIEAKTRADFRMVSDDDANQEVAEAMSQRLKEIERETRADRACSDAYASQVKTGLGWVHVTRNSDPFKYPYKVEHVHRREMFWDWSSKDQALEDARYVIRQKWYPTDHVTAALPQHAQLINAAGSGWSPDWIERAREDTALMNAIDQEGRVSVSAWDWRNIDNRQVSLQECWYATYVRGLILRLPDRVVEFDRRNQLHMAAVGSGQVRPEPAVYRKLRCSLWFGPHLLQDYDPGANALPYVPFWGFREDLTGTPYGLIRNMIPLQDEVNARRRKLMHLLSSKRVQIDSDALDKRFNTFEDLIDEIARPDSLTVMNPSRTNKDAMRVESDLGLSQQQFEILQEAKEGIQAAAGIFNSIMGKADGAKSGLAINSLVEQSSNTLGEVNDNFKFGRQLVGERLVALQRADWKGREVKVMVGEQEARRKSIFLNTPKVDEITGVKYLENNVETATVKVALEDVPSTPAYRAQHQMMISEVLKSLPPQLQAPLIPFFLESTDLPKRHEMTALLRKTLGQEGPDGQPVDPLVQQLKQQLEALQQQSEQMADQYEQAVQEEAQKAQLLQQKVGVMELQLQNKAGELDIRRGELQLKAAQNGGAPEKQDALASAKLDLDAKKLTLEDRKLSIEEMRIQSEHDREMARMESQQLSGVDGQGGENEGAEIAKVQEIVASALAPLSDKVDMLIDAVQADAAGDAAEMAPAKPRAAARTARASAPAVTAPVAAAPAPVPADGLAAAVLPSSVATASASVPRKPRAVTFERGPDGKLMGASLDGKPVATIKRDDAGRMVGADLHDDETAEGEGDD